MGPLGTCLACATGKAEPAEDVGWPDGATPPPVATPPPSPPGDARNPEELAA